MKSNWQEWLSNAGTSDGVRKGWVTRHGAGESMAHHRDVEKRSMQSDAGRTASQASWGAHNAEQDADESQESAQDLYDSHMSAADAHKAAAAEAEKAGDHDVSAYHKFRSRSHVSKALPHLEHGAVEPDADDVQNSYARYMREIQVNNHGTSAGLEKSWITRHNGRAVPEYAEAFEAAQSASRDTRSANAKDLPARHRAAAIRHAAARDIAEKNGYRSDFDYHNIMAASHDTKAKILGGQPSYRNNTAPKAAWEAWLAPKAQKDAQNAPTGQEIAGNEALNNAGTSEGANSADPDPEVKLSNTAWQGWLSNDGDGAPSTGPGGSSMGANVPASGPNIQGPNGRLGALSPNPVIKKFAAGATQEAYRNIKAEEEQETVKNALRRKAKELNGWLPNSHELTKKEIEAARKELPFAKPGMVKNGTRKSVTLTNGISKGKKVDFVFNEKRKSGNLKDNQKEAEWIPEKWAVDDENKDNVPSMLQ